MSTYSNLKIEEITLGDSGWGTSTTNNLLAVQQALQSVTLATGDFTANVATLPWTNTSSTTNTPRAMVLNITATLSGAGTVNLPAITGGKPYLVVNGSGYAVTVKVTGLTGVSVPSGKSMWLWNNGTDIVDGTNYISSLSLGTDLAVADGGTGASTALGARTNLGAAAAGANTDITSLAGLTTALSVAQGGTGATTATAAFNGLSPSTTKGDLITNDGTNDVRLGVGSNNQALVADSTQSSGLKWATLTGLTNATSITDAATITPDINYSQYAVTALAQSATFAAPSAGVDGQKLILRILDNGTSRNLTWTTTSGGYRAISSALPSSTTANKVIYVGLIYNSQAVYWDVVSVITQN